MLCLQGDAQAEGIFERQFLMPVRPVLSAVSPSPDTIDDLMQDLHLRLLGERRLEQYSGSGPLRGWLRRVAVNALVNAEANGRREVRLELAPAALTQDPELSYLKETYRTAFNEAFVAALRGLSMRQRTLLRLNALGDASIDELAEIFHVHRATTARWVQLARKELIERTRAEMGRRIQLPAADLDELMALLRSQLDVSLRRYLGAVNVEEDVAALAEVRR